MILLRQKEYGIGAGISTLAHSKRNSRAYRKAERTRARTKEDKELADRIRDHAERCGQKLETSDNASFNVTPVAKGNIFDSIFGKRNPDSIVTDRTLAAKHGGNFRTGTITARKDSTAATIAHEHGHGLSFANPKGGYQEFTDRYKKRSKLTDSGLFGIGGGERVKGSGAEGYRNAIELGKMNLDEELVASKNGLRVLAKEGASPRQMRKSRKELKTALKTYYENGRAQASSKMIGDSDVEALKLRNTLGKELKDKYKSGLKELDTIAKSEAEKDLDKKIRNAKIGAGIGIGAAAAIGATAYGVHKYKQRKKEQEEEEV